MHNNEMHNDLFVATLSITSTMYNVHRLKRIFKQENWKPDTLFSPICFEMSFSILSFIIIQ